MAKIRESSLMGKRLQQAWRENLHQMSPAQAFAALYASLWIYSGVQDEQLWRQIYHNIITKQPFLRLGNAMIWTVELPKTNYGYYGAANAAENSKAQLFTTHHIIPDDVSLMWIVYLKQHLPVKAPTFEQTMQAFEKAMQACQQTSKLKSNHIKSMEKGLYHNRQLLTNSKLDMQMSAIVSDRQKHTSISIAN